MYHTDSPTVLYLKHIILSLNKLIKNLCDEGGLIMPSPPPPSPPPRALPHRTPNMGENTLFVTIDEQSIQSILLTSYLCKRIELEKKRGKRTWEHPMTTLPCSTTSHPKHEHKHFSQQTSFQELTSPPHRRHTGTETRFGPFALAGVRWWLTRKARRG